MTRDQLQAAVRAIKGARIADWLTHTRRASNELTARQGLRCDTWVHFG